MTEVMDRLNAAVIEHRNVLDNAMGTEARVQLRMLEVLGQLNERVAALEAKLAAQNAAFDAAMLTEEQVKALLARIFPEFEFNRLNSIQLGALGDALWEEGLKSAVHDEAYEVASDLIDDLDIDIDEIEVKVENVTCRITGKP